MPLGDVLVMERTPIALAAKETYRRIGIYSWGKGMLRRDPASVVEMGSMKYFSFPIPSLIFSNIQAWEGAVALAGGEDAGFVCSSRFYPYVPRAGVDVNFRYLLEFFRSKDGLALMRRASPGTQVRNKVLSRAGLEAGRVPLPSRADQDRIAAHCSRLAANLGSAHAASITEMIGADAAWLRAVFDSDWPLVALGEVFDLSRGSVLKQDPNGSALALGQASVRWGNIDRSLAKPLDDEWAGTQDPSRRVTEGDLLLNSTGEGTIGRAAVVRSEDAGMLHDSKVMKLRPSGAVHPEFAALFLRSPQGQDAVSLTKGANTTKQTELGIRRTAGLLVPAPPSEVQQRVVHTWQTLGPLFARAAQLQNQRNLLAASMLPSVRNEIFNAMR